MNDDDVHDAKDLLAALRADEELDADVREALELDGPMDDEAIGALDALFARVDDELGALDAPEVPDDLVARTVERATREAAEAPGVVGSVWRLIASGWASLLVLIGLPALARRDRAADPRRGARSTTETTETTKRPRPPRWTMFRNVGAIAVGCAVVTLGVWTTFGHTVTESIQASTVMVEGLRGPSSGYRVDSNETDDLSEQRDLGGRASLTDSTTVADPSNAPVDLEQGLFWERSGETGEDGSRVAALLLPSRDPVSQDPVSQDQDGERQGGQFGNAEFQQRVPNLLEDDERNGRDDRASGLPVQGSTGRIDNGVIDEEVVSRALGDDRAQNDRWRDDDESDTDGDALAGLRFHPRTGAWANTYLPGDPAWRDLARTVTRAPEARRLSDAAAPFDARLRRPRRDALALTVRADRRQVDGASRVRMQVGIAAAAGRTRRPTLRTVVVIDAREADAVPAAEVEAVLTALSQARSTGDQVGVIVAGESGGVLRAPAELRLGEARVLAREVHTDGRAAMSLEHAYREAVTLAGALEADAPLGSGLVLVVSPRLAGGEALVPTARAGALAGVTSSVLALRTPGADATLESFALAGHGRRWFVGARPADEVLRDEVAAASRSVARALRLEVVLAPGTRLVDVVGSRPLAAPQEATLRRAEQAIDRQLAAQLGIGADRGADAEGLRVYLPVFLSGDTHTMIFDLVVDGPGEVADVRLRYKDLLALGNREARESLQLGRGDGAPGPAERLVRGDLATQRLALALESAGRDLPRARAHLQRASTELDRHVAPLGEAHARHRALLDHFLAALDAPPPHLAAALQHAGRRLRAGDPLSLGAP